MTDKNLIHGIDPDLLLDDIANAFEEEWDLGRKVEDQLRASIRVLMKEVEFKPTHVLVSLLHHMARTKKDDSLFRFGADMMRASGCPHPPHPNCPRCEDLMDEARESLADHPMGDNT